MKKEGRQLGMVTTYKISQVVPKHYPRSKKRIVNKFDPPPTTGIFTKVSSKPTNHSKFTNKTKGTNKHKYSGVVMEGRTGFRFFGFSATGLLDHFSCAYTVDDEVEDIKGHQVDYPDPVHVHDSYSFADLFNY